MKNFASDEERRAYFRAAQQKSRAQHTPQTNRQAWRDNQRHYRAAHPRTKAADREFIGCDGEGGDLAGPLSHTYLLLRIGKQTIENPAGLSAEECLGFIADQEPNKSYIAYYFDYDVTMILRGLSNERLLKLLDREGRSHAKDGTKLNRALPVEVFGQYEIDYMPTKYFMVRRSGTKKWVTINDVGPFFQCSFLKAIKLWKIGTPEQWERIEAGKFSRSTFTAMTDEIRHYNGEEVELLQELMEAFRETCKDVGYVPSQWQGPGYLAVSMFQRNRIPKTKVYLDNLPIDFLIASRNAFYGGRFETASVGPVPGPVYQYDINSAYPWALTQLPCLEHGRWSHMDDPDSPFVLRKVRFKERAPGKAQVAFMGLPIRHKDGSIVFPERGTGWYWSCELDAAKHQQYKTLDAWSYRKHCQCVPFSWIPNVYQERLALGKAARGIVLKLGLNSMYGKMVQSVGNPPYAQPVWGSLITSLVRAKLYSGIHSGQCSQYRCGARVHMLATDALFSTEPLDLPCSKELGEWDFEEHPSMFIVQPGVYWLGEGDKLPKTRGIPQRDVIAHKEHFLELFATDWTGRIDIPLVSFFGMRIALAQHKRKYLGQWIDIHKRVGFAWQSKRQGRGPKGESLDKDKYGCYRTDVIRLDESVETVPYSKDIGRIFEKADIEGGMLDQPDFRSDTFVQDEGKDDAD